MPLQIIDRVMGAVPWPTVTLVFQIPVVFVIIVDVVMMLPRKSGHTVKLLYATFGFQIQEARDNPMMNAS